MVVMQMFHQEALVMMVVMVLMLLKPVQMLNCLLKTMASLVAVVAVVVLQALQILTVQQLVYSLKHSLVRLITVQHQVDHMPKTLLKTIQQHTKKIIQKHLPEIILVASLVHILLLTMLIM